MYSYVYVVFSLIFDLPYDKFDTSIYFATPVRQSVVITHMYPSFFYEYADLDRFRHVLYYKF